MTRLWADEGRARLKDAKLRKREREAARRRRRMNTVIHPVKTAKKRWLPW